MAKTSSIATPSPRFVYDLKDYYLTQAKWWQQPLLQFLIRYVQPRYERAIKKMDVIIAISENVKRRIIKYYLYTNRGIFWYVSG